MGMLLTLLLLFRAEAGQLTLLQQFLQPVSAFRAEFVQRSLDEQGRLLAEDRGWLVLARPNRFRWQVEAPFAQIVLSDGERLWQVDPELNQAVVQPLAGQQAGGWLWIWTHPDRLEQRFIVQERRDGPGTGQMLLQARPGQSQGLDSVRLQFEAGRPTRIVSEDALGGRVVIELHRLEIDPPLADDLFRYQPPAGMDVLRQHPEPLP